MSKMTEKTKVSEKYLCAAYPMIFVADVTKAADYYRNKLGFKVAYLYGDPPFYGMMTRDGAGLHFRHVCKNPVDRTEDDLLATAIPVKGVKALFLEFKKKGVEFHQTLKAQPWGSTDFIVKDIDGNLLCFASALEKRSGKG
jgi:catechol 2,3-dioxygenase-like lactoylglutathione lyase family enzyme